MNTDRDEQIAAWFADAQQELSAAEFARSVMETLRASQRRRRLSMVTVMVLVLAGSWPMRSALLSMADAATHVVMNTLAVSGQALASPLAWLLCLVLGAALWPIVRSRL